MSVDIDSHNECEEEASCKANIPKASVPKNGELDKEDEEGDNSEEDASKG